MPEVTHVYLDSNIVIQAGKPPASPILARVGDLVTMKTIELWTTEITIDEVTNKHVENDYAVISHIGRPHFRRLVADVFSTNLPKLNKTDIKQALVEKYREAVGQMFLSIGAHSLPIDKASPSEVLRQYADRRGFFGLEGKKDQFPDAFIFEAVKPLASADTPVVIVSDDKDFVQPAAETDHIIVLKSLTDLFKHLGLEIEDPNVEASLDRISHEVINAFSHEVGNWSLIVVDIEDAEIDPNRVADVVFYNLTSFGEAEEDGRILVTGEAEVTVNAWVSYPDWVNASYNSEDKVLIPHNQLEGDIDVELHILFSMTLLSGSEEQDPQIDELQFLDDSFIYIELESQQV